MSKGRSKFAQATNDTDKSPTQEDAEKKQPHERPTAARRSPAQLPRNLWNREETPPPPGGFPFPRKALAQKRTSPEKKLDSATILANRRQLPAQKGMRSPPRRPMLCNQHKRGAAIAEEPDRLVEPEPEPRDEAVSPIPTDSPAAPEQPDSKEETVKDEAKDPAKEKETENKVKPQRKREDDSDIVLDKSPDGRYLKTSVELGRGSFKTVYRGVDSVTAVDVAWCELMERKWNKIERLRFREEAEMLKGLQHQNIVRFYDYWEVAHPKRHCIVLVTELMTSGTLKQYLRRLRKVSVKVLKRWCQQILKGLQFLHSRKPPIIHRDLKCDNIFITGTNGLVKIGDLGLATLKNRSCAKSVIGTPEFMAPEVYEEHYDEGVDVYAFGMCMMEMSTLEYPYGECSGPAQIYRKVTSGVRPLSFNKIEDENVREIIDWCTRLVCEQRPTAQNLLSHDFFQDDMGFKVELVSKEDCINSDSETILFRLQVTDPVKRKDKHKENEAIEFDFDLKSDSPAKIAEGMVQMAMITSEDTVAIDRMINSNINNLKRLREDRRRNEMMKEKHEDALLLQQQQESLQQNQAMIQIQQMNQQPQAYQNVQGIYQQQPYQGNPAIQQQYQTALQNQVPPQQVPNQHIPAQQQIVQPPSQIPQLPVGQVTQQIPPQIQPTHQQHIIQQQPVPMHQQQNVAQTQQIPQTQPPQQIPQNQPPQQIPQIVNQQAGTVLQPNQHIAQHVQNSHPVGTGHGQPVQHVLQQSNPADHTVQQQQAANYVMQPHLIAQQQSIQPVAPQQTIPQRQNSLPLVQPQPILQQQQTIVPAPQQNKDSIQISSLQAPQQDQHVQGLPQYQQPLLQVSGQPIQHQGTQLLQQSAQQLQQHTAQHIQQQLQQQAAQQLQQQQAAQHVAQQLQHQVALQLQQQQAAQQLQQQQQAAQQLQQPASQQLQQAAQVQQQSAPQVHQQQTIPQIHQQQTVQIQQQQAAQLQKQQATQLLQQQAAHQLQQQQAVQQLKQQQAAKQIQQPAQQVSQQLPQSSVHQSIHSDVVQQQQTVVSIPSTPQPQQFANDQLSQNTAQQTVLHSSQQLPVYQTELKELPVHQTTEENTSRQQPISQGQQSQSVTVMASHDVGSVSAQHNMPITHSQSSAQNEQSINNGEIVDSDLLNLESKSSKEISPPHDNKNFANLNEIAQLNQPMVSQTPYQPVQPPQVYQTIHSMHNVQQSPVLPMSHSNQTPLVHQTIPLSQLANNHIPAGVPNQTVIGIGPQANLQLHAAHFSQPQSTIVSSHNGNIAAVHTTSQLFTGANVVTTNGQTTVNQQPSQILQSQSCPPMHNQFSHPAQLPPVQNIYAQQNIVNSTESNVVTSDASMVVTPTAKVTSQVVTQPVNVYHNPVLQQAAHTFDQQPAVLLQQSQTIQPQQAVLKPVQGQINEIHAENVVADVDHGSMPGAADQSQTTGMTDPSTAVNIANSYSHIVTDSNIVGQKDRYAPAPEPSPSFNISMPNLNVASDLPVLPTPPANSSLSSSTRNLDSISAASESECGEYPADHASVAKTQPEKKKRKKKTLDRFPKFVVLSVSGTIVECQLETMNQKTVTFQFDANNDPSSDITNNLVVSNLLPQIHSDVFTKMVDEIIKQVEENPNTIPVVSIVESRATIQRSPSTTRKNKGEELEKDVGESGPGTPVRTLEDKEILEQAARDADSRRGSQGDVLQDDIQQMSLESAKQKTEVTQSATDVTKMDASGNFESMVSSIISNSTSSPQSLCGSGLPTPQNYTPENTYVERDAGRRLTPQTSVETQENTARLTKYEKLARKLKELQSKLVENPTNHPNLTSHTYPPTSIPSFQSQKFYPSLPGTPTIDINQDLNMKLTYDADASHGLLTNNLNNIRARFASCFIPVHEAGTVATPQVPLYTTTAPVAEQAAPVKEGESDLSPMIEQEESVQGEGTSYSESITYLSDLHEAASLQHSNVAVSADSAFIPQVTTPVNDILVEGDIQPLLSPSNAGLIAAGCKLPPTGGNETFEDLKAKLANIVNYGGTPGGLAMAPLTDGAAVDGGYFMENNLLQGQLSIDEIENQDMVQLCSNLVTAEATLGNLPNHIGEPKHKQFSRFQVTKVIEKDQSESSSPSLTPIKRGRFAVTKIDEMSEETDSIPVDGFENNPVPIKDSVLNDFTKPEETYNCLEISEKDCKNVSQAETRIIYADPQMNESAKDEENEISESGDLSEDDDSYRILKMRQEQELSDMRQRHQIEKEQLKVRRFQQKKLHLKINCDQLNKKSHSFQLPVCSPSTTPTVDSPGSPEERQEIGEQMKSKKGRILPEDMMDLVNITGNPQFHQRKKFNEKLTLNQLKLQQLGLAQSSIPSRVYTSLLPSASQATKSDGQGRSESKSPTFGEWQ